MGQVETVSLIPSSTPKRQAQPADRGRQGTVVGCIIPTLLFLLKAEKRVSSWIRELGPVWLGKTLLG